MPNSLRAKISSLRYKGKITDEEYKDLISKLDGHDKALRTPWIPCSKEMPPYYELVIVSLNTGEVDMMMLVEYRAFDGNEKEYKTYWTDSRMEHHYILEVVEAWMPKPEYYKRGGE